MLCICVRPFGDPVRAEKKLENNKKMLIIDKNNDYISCFLDLENIKNKSF